MHRWSEHFARHDRVLRIVPLSEQQLCNAVQQHHDRLALQRLFRSGKLRSRWMHLALTTLLHTRLHPPPRAPETDAPEDADATRRVSVADRSPEIPPRAGAHRAAQAQAARGTVTARIAQTSQVRPRDQRQEASLQMVSNLLWAACGVNRPQGPFGTPGITAACATQLPGNRCIPGHGHERSHPTPLHRRHPQALAHVGLSRAGLAGPRRSERRTSTSIRD